MSEYTNFVFLQEKETQEHGSTGHESKTDVGGMIFHHILNSDYIDVTPVGKIYLPYMFFDKEGFHFFKSRHDVMTSTTYKIDEHHMPVKVSRVDGMPIGLDLSISKHLVFLWLASLLLILVVRKAAKNNMKNLVPKGIGNFIELMIVYIRDEIVVPNIGDRGKAMLPIFLTIFFFILFSNLLGLVPYSATATSNISVTAGLAILAFFIIQIAGIMKNGFFGYFKGLIPPHMPIPLLPIIIVVEFLGILTKPFALCIRLFANMTAGHVVILSLLGLIFVFKTALVSPVSIGFALFIYLLEILVAVIQAYIFTILTALFTGMAIHQEH